MAPSETQMQAAENENRKFGEMIAFFLGGGLIFSPSKQRNIDHNANALPQF